MVDYLFPAIEPQSGSAIIQPVLEWNNSGSNRWTGAAWYVAGNTSYRATGVNVNVGDSLTGVMAYDYGQSTWEIDFQDNTTGQSSGASYWALGTSNLAVFTVLEGWNVVDDNDLPYTTYFTGMDFEYNLNPVSFSWGSAYSYPSGVTGPPNGLDVIINSQSDVTLQTANGG